MAARNEGRVEGLSPEELEEACTRIQLSPHELEPRGSLDVLKKITRGMVENVPFEQLDVALGRGINPELGVVLEKIVRRKRGGYCYESNTLLGALLKTCGFDPVPLVARVILNGRVGFSSHKIFVATTTSGDKFIADVGFGANTPNGPLPLGSIFGDDLTSKRKDVGSPILLYPWAYRFVDDANQFETPGGTRLQRFDSLEWIQAGQPPIDTAKASERFWKNMYVFHLERPVFEIDFWGANWWVSTSPVNNHFTASRVAVLQTRAGIKILHNNLSAVITRNSSPDLRELFPSEQFPEDSGGPADPVVRVEKEVRDEEYMEHLISEFNIDLSWDHRTAQSRTICIKDFTDIAMGKQP